MLSSGTQSPAKATFKAMKEKGSPSKSTSNLKCNPTKALLRLPPRWVHACISPYNGLFVLITEEYSGMGLSITRERRRKAHACACH